jgi:hypothetical protein
VTDLYSRDQMAAADEPRAPVNTMSRCEREALLACLDAGELQKRAGAWRSPDGAFTAAGVTIANLTRDGFMKLTGPKRKAHRCASAKLNTRGLWYARSLATQATKVVSL